jgi:Secretion system C-terminal sorting domain
MIKKIHYLVLIVSLCLFSQLKSQNLVVDGNISSTNVNWGGGASEAPFTNSTFEDTYLTTGCNQNYVMEVDNASNPTQVVNGFTSGSQYILTFRYGWRNTGCNASVNPTNLVIQFTDAVGILNVTQSVGSATTTLTPVSFVFTNNASTSHTLKFTNPGNVNSCGVVVDDISITRVASPGGVGTANLSLWFNAGSIGIADNSNVYAWISSGNGTNSVVALPPCASPPVYKTGLASSANSFVANFNPYLTFNGSTQYIEHTLARLNLNDLSAGGAGGSYFASYTGGTAGRTVFGHQGSGNSRIFAANNEIIFAQSSVAGTNNDVTVTNNARVNITAVNGKSNGVTVRDWNGNNLALANNSINVDYLTIGAKKSTGGGYSLFFDGTVSEIMAFNNILTNTQMQQVRSYMAAKYGVTLTDNSTTAGIDERSYIASNGATTYWNVVANAGFHNNVTVIGRDDNTALDQRKSVSTDADANGWMANSMLTINNGAAFTSDISYLAAGHNGMGLNVPTEVVDVPAGIQSRMPRFWKFQKTGAGVAASVTLTFDMTGFAPLTGSDLRLLVSTVNTFGTATTTIVAGAYVAPNFTVTMATTGGVFFTVGSVNVSQTPLPIELLSFNAKPCNNNVCLDWATATETNNDFFTVEKTQDGSKYDFVAKVNGAGNSTTVKDYTSIDKVPYAGVSYYRLKQTDYNGVYTYSALKTVEFTPSSEFSFNLYPNPGAGADVNVAINASKGEEVLVVVYDVTGRETYSKVLITEDAGQNVFALDPSGKLSPGIYLITATSQQSVYSKKLIIK